MLYAIHVLKKKILMEEKSYILFWQVKKNVNIETCMFARYTEPCFVWWNLSATTALTFPHNRSFRP